MRMGGLGLRSAERCAHAAYWADALHMIAQRNPAVAEMVVQSMSDDTNPGEGSLAELKMATDRLDRQGFWWRPSWSELQEGRRPETHTDGEPGEWQQLQEDDRSHSGRNAGAALAGCPTCPEFTIPPHLFRTLILERLRLPLQMTERHCEGVTPSSTPWDVTGPLV